MHVRIDRLKDLIRRQPADRATTVHEDRHRGINGTVIRAFIFRIDEFGRIRQAAPFVREHEQVWELGLRLFRVL